MPQHRRRCLAETHLPGPALVEPEAVGRLEVVADIQVGFPVAVQVAELRRQAPFEGGMPQGIPRGIEERPLGPWHGHPAVAAVVAIQDIGFTQLFDAPGGVDLETVGQVGSRGGAAVQGGHHRAVAFAPEGRPGVGQVHEGLLAVVADVEVDPSVAVHIGQRQRMPPAGGHLGEWARAEDALTFVDQHAHPVGMGVDHQVDPSVAGQVGGTHAGHIAPEALQPLRKRLLGDVVEAESPAVAPQGRLATRRTQEHIEEPVAIHVGKGDPGTIEQELIGEVP